MWRASSILAQFRSDSVAVPDLAADRLLPFEEAIALDVEQPHGMAAFLGNYRMPVRLEGQLDQGADFVGRGSSLDREPLRDAIPTLQN